MKNSLIAVTLGKGGECSTSFPGSFVLESLGTRFGTVGLSRLFKNCFIVIFGLMKKENPGNNYL